MKPARRDYASPQERDRRSAIICVAIGVFVAALLGLGLYFMEFRPYH